MMASLHTVGFATPQQLVRIDRSAGAARGVAGLPLQDTPHRPVVVVIRMQESIDHLTYRRVFTIERICVHFVGFFGLYSTHTGMLMLQHASSPPYIGNWKCDIERLKAIARRLTRLTSRGSILIID